MINTFLSSLGSKLFLTLLLTSTLLTTGVAISKVSSSFATSQIPNKGINIQAAEKEAEPTGVVEQVITPMVRTIARIPTVVKSIVTPTPFPVAVIPTKTPVVANNTGNQCLIIISGLQYDVTKLRTTHSGGDVFKCGTDMTSVYIGRHGTNMSRMQAYLVTNGGNNNKTGGTTTVTPTSGQKFENNDDREDSEHEDRYIKQEDHADGSDD